MYKEHNIMGGDGFDEQDEAQEEGSVVDIGDMLDLEDTIEHGQGREGVRSQPPQVTRWGGVFKRGHLGQQMPDAGSQCLSPGWSPSIIPWIEVWHQVEQLEFMEINSGPNELNTIEVVNRYTLKKKELNEDYIR